jgi:hypothetical protein
MKVEEWCSGVAVICIEGEDPVEPHVAGPGKALAAAIRPGGADGTGNQVKADG